VVEYSVERDIAHQVGTFVFADTKSPVQGKLVETLMRQEDGAWKVSEVIFNGDGPWQNAIAPLCQKRSPKGEQIHGYEKGTRRF
jgi:hypothetical protein